MKNKIITLLLISSSGFLGHSQNLPTIVPPSPDAAALAQYADVPVSNYTGIPNISVPLFDIKSGKIELPISLSYHASGIKVAQEASSVGLGWVLNAGGVITRQVRGFDDFLSGGGYINTHVPPSTSYNLPDNSANNPEGNPMKYFNEYYNWLNYPDKLYRIDGEPDMFYYNFMGYSGQLMFEQKNYSNEGVTAVSIDQNNLKFSFSVDGKEWTVTDGNGWKYYFGKNSLNAIENTTSYDYTLEGPFATNPYIDKSRNIRGLDSSTEFTDTAWYLTKVVTPEGDKIEFVYADNFLYKTLSNLSYSESIAQDVGQSFLYDNGYLVLNAGLLAKKYFSTFSQEEVVNVYLKKIVFKNGYIEFKTEDRDDMRKYHINSYHLKPQKIKSAELFDLNNNSIKKVDFNYSYFNSDEYILQSQPEHKEDFLRLRLDSVVESFKDKDSQSCSSFPPYVFTYNNIALPDKLSFSIDFWGYYNGKYNDNIAPYDYDYLRSNPYGIQVGDNNIITDYLRTVKMLCPKYVGSAYGDLSYLAGANRDVDPVMSQAAILKKIIYPTGGSMSFDYSSNTYCIPGGYDEGVEQFHLEDAHDLVVLPQDKEATFTINEPVLFYMDFNVRKNDYGYSSNPTPFFGVAGLEKLNGNKVVYLKPDLEFNEWGDYSTHLSVSLSPGTYRLYADKGNDSMSDVVIDAYYKTKIASNKKYGAGIRIDAITTIDKDNVIKRKKYSYEADGISTGSLLSPMNYWYNEDLFNSTDRDLNINGGLSLWNSSNTLTRSSNNAHPFGSSAQGKIMGYDQVTVSDVDLNNNSLGSSQYFYENIKELPAEYFIPGVPNRINLSNGQLLKEINTNKEGKTVRIKNYVYEKNAPSNMTIKGVMRFDTFNPINNLLITSIRFYDVNSEWRYLKSKTETTYDINGNNPITTSTTYKYDNRLHKNLTETRAVNSKGEQIITTNQYSPDHPAGTGMTTGDFDAMTAKNIINPVIKQETKVNSNLLSTQVTAYSNWDDVFLLVAVKTAKGTNPLEDRVQYHGYYPNGNVKEVSKADGTHIVYIWGYHDEYPIAKIENAVYSEVSAYMNDLQSKSNSDTDHCLDTQSCNEKNLRDALNSLRNDPAYRSKWQVNTYTYDPLIGITSMTDSKGYIVYYEYDEFNHLKQVKDQDGNILNKNEYHYKNQ